MSAEVCSYLGQGQQPRPVTNRVLEGTSLMRRVVFALASIGLTSLAGCTATGATERNALGGAMIGAVAGAVIGNNVGDGDGDRGAMIGAAIGGSAGAIRGCRQDGGCGGEKNRRQFYDESADRYYYRDPSDGRFYWESGSPRS